MLAKGTVSFVKWFTTVPLTCKEDCAAAILHSIRHRFSNTHGVAIWAIRINSWGIKQGFARGKLEDVLYSRRKGYRDEDKGFPYPFPNFWQLLI
jgi:hypothetical protein